MIVTRLRPSDEASVLTPRCTGKRAASAAIAPRATPRSARGIVALIEHRAAGVAAETNAAVSPGLKKLQRDISMHHFIDARIRKNKK
jgi:hypothetical protein